MIKTILLNGLMNFGLGTIFVFLNSWALKNNFEETFVALALLYGIVVIAENVLFISIFCRK